jgi:hypothetical protein
LLSVIGDIGAPRPAQFGDIALVDLGQRGKAITGVGLGGQNPVDIIPRRIQQRLGARQSGGGVCRKRRCRHADNSEPQAECLDDEPRAASLRRRALLVDILHSDLPQPAAKKAAVTAKKNAIAAAMSHNGFCSRWEDTAGGVGPTELVGGPSEASRRVSGEFINDLLGARLESAERNCRRCQEKVSAGKVAIRFRWGRYAFQP